jgi:hypothetical protein
VFDLSPTPITGYEAIFDEEMQHALETSAGEVATKYLHLKVAPYARWGFIL